MARRASDSTLPLTDIHSATDVHSAINHYSFSRPFLPQDKSCLRCQKRSGCDRPHLRNDLHALASACPVNLELEFIMNAIGIKSKSASHDANAGRLITLQTGARASVQPIQTVRFRALSTIAGLVAAFASPPAHAQAIGPCIQVRMACEQAGFVQGGVREGNGLQIDCVRPIMQGTPQPPNASMPLPPIDPQLVAACKARNPNFGQPRGATLGPVGQPRGPVQASAAPQPLGPAQTSATAQPPDAGQPALPTQPQAADPPSPCGPAPALPLSQ
jgi:hypothetical protein